MVNEVCIDIVNYNCNDKTQKKNKETKQKKKNKQNRCIKQKIVDTICNKHILQYNMLNANNETDNRRYAVSCFAEMSVFYNVIKI